MVSPLIVIIILCIIHLILNIYLYVNEKQGRNTSIITIMIDLIIIILTIIQING